MVHAQFTKEQLDEMVAISLEKYRLREGYGENDVTWNDLKGRIKDRLQKSFNGEEVPQNLNNKDKGLTDYVKDNFGQDKGSGLKKFGRQINRGAQVGTALATMATAAPIAKVAGKATRAAKAVPGAAKGILKRFIGEAAELDFEVPKEYTHFAIRKSDGKIVNGWDYSEFDPEDLRRFPKDYFIDDLIDMEVNPKLFKIATVRACKRMGIDPFDCKNWDNPAEGDWMEESNHMNGNMLNELDWKTYANAAKVAKEKGKKWNDEQGTNGRAERFNTQARKQFAKDKGYKFGYPYSKKEDGEFYIPTKPERFEPHFSPGLEDYEPDAYDDYVFPDISVRVPHAFIDNRMHDGVGSSVSRYNETNPLHKKLQDDWDEIHDYYTGKYNYTPDKGWHLKQESCDRKKNVNEGYGQFIVPDNRDYNLVVSLIMHRWRYSPYHIEKIDIKEFGRIKQIVEDTLRKYEYLYCSEMSPRYAKAQEMIQKQSAKIAYEVYNNVKNTGLLIPDETINTAFTSDKVADDIRFIQDVVSNLFEMTQHIQIRYGNKIVKR